MLKIVLGLVFGFIMLYAETFTVNTLDDTTDGSCSDGSCSLRDAISRSSSGDVINIDVTGVMTLSTRLPIIMHSLTINGSGIDMLEIKAGDEFNHIWHREGVLLLSDMKLSDGKNSSGNGGGAIFTDSLATKLILNNVGFHNNTAMRGGAIYFEAPVEISNAHFENNSADLNGGAIHGHHALTINNSTFLSNETHYQDVMFDGGGGAVCVTSLASEASHDVNISDSIFKSNVANSAYYGDGGAILIVNNTLKITRSLFNANVSSHRGGAICVSDHTSTASDTITITNTTFFGNIAYTKGGALYTHMGNGSLNISFSTITQNLSQGGDGHRGGGIYHESGELNIKSSVISYNYDGNSPTVLADCHSNDSENFNSFHSNIMARPGNCPLLSGYDGILGADQLELLADNGGPTKTCAPREGSLVVNNGGGCWDIAGNPVTVDQRGVPRNDGQCDVGAYEVNNFFGFTPILMYLLN